MQEAIQQLSVKAIFVGNTVNPGLAERLASDTGAQLVFFYSDSLSEPGGPAGTYLDMVRYNVGAIVNALANR
jgi:ABC-type Zn uptake system ZnuABC Zn-binding protein ZnuA